MFGFRQQALRDSGSKAGRIQVLLALCRRIRIAAQAVWPDPFGGADVRNIATGSRVEGLTRASGKDTGRAPPSSDSIENRIGDAEGLAAAEWQARKQSSRWAAEGYRSRQRCDRGVVGNNGGPHGPCIISHALSEG